MNNFKKKVKTVFVFAMFVSFYSYSNQGTDSKYENFKDCLKNGHTNGYVRLRDDNRSNEGKRDSVSLPTLSGRFGYEMDCGNGLKVYVEGIGSIAAVSDFNNGINGRNNKPALSDPNAINLHQGYVEFSPLKGQLSFKAGRQEIIWGDGTVVGAPAWRNLSQSFDAIRTFLTPTFLNDTSVEFAYLNNQINIRNQDLAMNTFLGNIEYHGLKDSHISIHSIALEYAPSTKLSNRSVQTYGIAFNIEKQIPNAYFKKTSVKLDTAFDEQSPYANNPNPNYNVYRWLLRGTVTIENVSFYVGNEKLSSSSGKYAYQRDLAARHAINGYADLFTNTPAVGLNDFQTGVTIKNLLFDEKSGGFIKGDNLALVFHNFSSDTGSKEIGQEFDAQITLNTDGVSRGSKLLLLGTLYNGNKNNPVQPQNDISLTAQVQVPFDLH